MRFSNTAALFVRAMHLWVAGFMLFALTEFERLWISPVSPELTFVNGPIKWLLQATSEFPAEFWAILVMLTVLISALSVLKGSSVFRAFFIWAAYVLLISRGWMVSTGGQQLVAIMLLWCIPLSSRNTGGLQLFAFWAARLQLVLVYLSTFLHKLQGSDWLNGRALEVLSSDPSFNFEFLQGLPVLAMVFTWTGLVFQLAFPLLIWFEKLRMPIMIAGIGFHLFTAWGIEIPDMALAFVFCYTVWFNDAMLDRSSWLNRLKPAVTSR